MQVLPLAISGETGELRQQQAAFCILTLFVLSLLLVLHTLFAPVLGEPSLWLSILLACGFASKLVEVIWLQSPGCHLTEESSRRETAVSILLMFTLTGLLAYLTNRDDSPYFVLLGIPVLQSAYFLSFRVMMVVVVAADSMILFWMWHYYRLHPPARATEYMEAGMISVIYFLMGTLVWFLVDQLRAKQLRLANSLEALGDARQQLIQEANLAAVGRLASGIAHEIRNPVAIISSALLTAANPETLEPDRDEMFGIAARESRRLERLTNDFLTYARPAEIRRHSVRVHDLLSYVADVISMAASETSISVEFDVDDALDANLDSSLIEAALLNLALNAVDAVAKNGRISIVAEASQDALVIRIRNSGPKIADSDLEHIFEPFFTTKPGGTGLGLAIARTTATAHGGHLSVSVNEDGKVEFSMTVSNAIEGQVAQEVIRG